MIKKRNIEKAESKKQKSTCKSSDLYDYLALSSIFFINYQSNFMKNIFKVYSFLVFQDLIHFSYEFILFSLSYYIFRRKIGIHLQHKYSLLVIKLPLFNIFHKVLNLWSSLSPFFIHFYFWLDVANDLNMATMNYTTFNLFYSSTNEIYELETAN